jgi:ABC-type transport system involved in multi-copper enzyme maturation permease subunit
MREILLIARHELRVLGRNRKMLGSIAMGLGVILMLLFANLRDRAGEDLTGLFFFALIGAAVGVPLSVAINAVAGEKQRGTIEPLLLLPVPTRLLVAGKAAVTLLLSAVALALVYLVALGQAVALKNAGALATLMDPRTVYTATVLAPLTLLPFTLLAMAVSARSPDTQTASATSFLLLLPLWLVLLGVWMGMIGINQRFLLLSTVALLALGAGAFAVAVRVMSDGQRLVGRRS